MEKKTGIRKHKRKVWRGGGGRKGAREGELGGSEWGDKREEDAAQISFF